MSGLINSLVNLLCFHYCVIGLVISAVSPNVLAVLMIGTFLSTVPTFFAGAYAINNVATYVATCYSCNMGIHDLPDIICTSPRSAFPRVSAFIIRQITSACVAIFM